MINIDSPINAKLEDPSQIVPDPSTAAASLFQPGDWNAAYDHNSQKWYYYNLKTDERSWDPPPGWICNDAPEAGPSLTAPAAAGSLEGFYYTDAHGTEQGPFSINQLLQWRSALPMDIPVWAINEGEKPKLEKSADEKPNSDQEAPLFIPKRASIPLAEVLGDVNLLSQWRALHPEITEETTCAAPSATHFEKELYQTHQQEVNNPANDDDDDIFNTTDTTSSREDLAASLAQAVIAGLPADDEAVHLSRVAASAGQSLHEVVEWSRKQSAAQEEYAVTAVHTAGTGRIQVVGKERESLYVDMGSWIDPRKMEEQMMKKAESGSGGKRKLTAAEVKAAKLRKQEIKETKQRAWLMD